jgi:hypothetical protein
MIAQGKALIMSKSSKEISSPAMAAEDFGNQFRRVAEIGVRLFTREENASPLICSSSSSFQ